MTKELKKHFLISTPVVGSLVFIILYIIATLLYPGGSQADKNSHGFSWLNNYWCNLLNEKAINGMANPARPIALTGTFVLCVSLSFFWYTFPRFINLKKPGRLTIQCCGILSMVIAMFLFTGFHDIATNMSGFFGVIALIGTFIGLRKIKWYGLFWFGIANLLLVSINNYVYYTKEIIIYLPVIQKISFVFFLLWICCIAINMYRQLNLE